MFPTLPTLADFSLMFGAINTPSPFKLGGTPGRRLRIGSRIGQQAKALARRRAAFKAARVARRHNRGD